MFENRLIRAVAVAAALALAAGCSNAEPTEPTDSASPSPSAEVKPSPSATPSASASPTATVPQPKSTATSLEGLTVTGDQPAVPVLKIPSPWAIKDTTVKVLKAGTGAKVPEKSTIVVNYLGMNGRTGKIFDSSWKRGQPATFPVDNVVKGFREGLVGQKVGSRVLIGIPSKDGYPEGQGADILKGDTIVFVVDILNASLVEPEGKAQPQKATNPKVSEGTGKPTLTLPAKYTAPKDLQVIPIIVGTGPKVKADDIIKANFLVASAKDGKILRQTYDTGPMDNQLSKLIEGWKKGLTGQTVGSRILLVVPPSMAYPDGNKKSDIPANEPLIYVVDLLMRSDAPKEEKEK